MTTNARLDRAVKRAQLHSRADGKQRYVYHTTIGPVVSFFPPSQGQNYYRVSGTYAEKIISTN
jgi:hypothetical protein